MSTALFLDIENMGGVVVRKAVDTLIRKFSPTKKEIVYSTASKLPNAFKDIDGWSVYRCKPGKNAADVVIQSHIVDALENEDIEQIILITSDHGFAKVCRKVVAAGKKLLLVVRQLGRLSKGVLAHFASGVEIFEVGNMKAPTRQSSVFIRSRDGEIREVPFSNGMTVGAFITALKDVGAYRKRLTHWINEMFLKVEDGRVYIMTEAIFGA